MPRFHISLTVADLNRSVGFYSRLFKAEPSVLKDDYAKWMLDEPRINFSLSARGQNYGVDHVGLQAEDEDELAELRARLTAADAPVFDQECTTCCYAKSKKAWVRDPDGVAWETFFSHGVAAEYGDGTLDESRLAGETKAACCVPA